MEAYRGGGPSQDWADADLDHDNDVDMRDVEIFLRRWLLFDNVQFLQGRSPDLPRRVIHMDAHVLIAQETGSIPPDEHSFSLPATPIFDVPPLQADLNNDGVVDDADQASLLAGLNLWRLGMGAAINQAALDVTGEGVFNMLDVLAFFRARAALEGDPTVAPDFAIVEFQQGGCRGWYLYTAYDSALRRVTIMGDCPGTAPEDMGFSERDEGEWEVAGDDADPACRWVCEGCPRNELFADVFFPEGPEGPKVFIRIDTTWVERTSATFQCATNDCKTKTFTKTVSLGHEVSLSLAVDILALLLNVGEEFNWSQEIVYSEQVSLQLCAEQDRKTKKKVFAKKQFVWWMVMNADGSGVLGEGAFVHYPDAHFFAVWSKPCECGST